MPEPPIPCSARKMILCLVVRRGLTRTWNDSQFKHVVDQATSNREDGEQYKGNEQHGLTTEDVAGFGIDDEKAYCPSQFTTILYTENGDGSTSVGQEVGGDDPTTLVESVESIRDADE